MTSSSVQKTCEELPPEALALRAAAVRIARESRLAQGLPPTIEDPSVMARLATLVASVAKR